MDDCCRLQLFCAGKAQPAAAWRKFVIFTRGRNTDKGELYWMFTLGKPV